MRVIGFYLCGWLLPLIACAGANAEVALRLVDGDYRAGDMVELHAEMHSREYTEFELHVPAQPQLHFVAHTREPVHYVDGEYVQRAVLLLQPLNAGEYTLANITASVAQGDDVSEQALPPFQFTVKSYATEDTSNTLMALGESTDTPTKSKKDRRLKLIVLMLLWVAWRIFRYKKSAPPAFVHDDVVDLDDVLYALEDGEDATRVIEQVLARDDIELSSELRNRLEAAVYAKGVDASNLIEQIRKEAQS